MKQITLLNPFSHSLGKNPFMQTNKEPIYIKGDYKIYKEWEENFTHTYKNIVIAQRCSPNKDLINNLFTDVKPVGESNLYHQYERPKQAISEGLEAAQKLNFLVQ